MQSHAFPCIFTARKQRTITLHRVICADQPAISAVGSDTVGLLVQHNDILLHFFTAESLRPRLIYASQTAFHSTLSHTTTLPYPTVILLVSNALLIYGDHPIQGYFTPQSEW